MEIRNVICIICTIVVYNYRDLFIVINDVKIKLIKIMEKKLNNKMKSIFKLVSLFFSFERLVLIMFFKLKSEY